MDKQRMSNSFDSKRLRHVFHSALCFLISILSVRPNYCSEAWTSDRTGCFDVSSGSSAHRTPILSSALEQIVLLACKKSFVAQKNMYKQLLVVLVCEWKKSYTHSLLRLFFFACRLRDGFVMFDAECIDQQKARCSRSPLEHGCARLLATACIYQFLPLA